MHQISQNIPIFVTALEPIVSQYGYLAVGGLITLEDFGLPTPGEPVLIAAAIFAGLGQLNIFLVALVAIAGAIVGDNIGFAIGQYGGHPLIERLGKYIFVTPQQINRAEQFVNRHGGKVIVLARFIEGLRQLNGIIAGASEMKWLKFLSFNIIGAILWVSLWSSVGYFGGNHIAVFLKYQLYLTIAVVIAIFIFIVYKLIQIKRNRSS